MNITDPIRRNAQTAPLAPAVVRWNTTVTYRQLDRLIDVLARRALDLGLGPGDVAGLAFPDLPGSGAAYKFIVLSLAMARAGIAVKAATTSDEGLAACFAADAGTPTRAPRLVVADETWFVPPPDSVEIEAVASHPDGKAICRIASTSGTTGTSKRVSISHEKSLYRVDVGRDPRLGPAMPIAIVHIGPWSGVGFFGVLRTLLAGGTLVLARKADDVLHAIARHGVNFVLLAPATLAAIVEAIPAGGDPPLGHGWVDVTGSFLPQPLYEQARSRLCPNIVTSYGSTEAGAVASARRSDLEGHPGAVGYVNAGIEAEAVGDDGSPLPPGEVGRIRIRGGTCVDGYDGDAEATAQAFRDGWFYPGDLGSVSADRLLSIFGRTSDLINIGGNKISPTVIENALLAVPGVADAAAFGVPDAHGLPAIWAALVVRGALAKTELEGVCRGLGYAAPKRVIRMEALPRNENGKVLRDELARIALRAPRARPAGGE